MDMDCSTVAHRRFNLFFRGLALLCFCCAISTGHSEAPLPYARLVDHTIELEPSKATFAIPQNWFDLYHNEHWNNLHLTRKELERVKEADNAQWDAEYAKIVNAVLPFENCAVHAGGDGWGSESVTYGDVQMRVYVGKWSILEMKRLVKEKGFPVATAIAMKMPEEITKITPPLRAEREVLKEEVIGEWQRLRIALPLRYDDYGGVGTVDFYVRIFRDETVVLVFMFASGAGQAVFIPPIVSSFKHP